MKVLKYYDLKFDGEDDLNKALKCAATSVAYLLRAVHQRLFNFLGDIKHRHVGIRVLFPVDADLSNFPRQGTSRYVPNYTQNRLGAI